MHNSLRLCSPSSLWDRLIEQDCTGACFESGRREVYAACDDGTWPDPPVRTGPDDNTRAHLRGLPSCLDPFRRDPRCRGRNPAFETRLAGPSRWNQSAYRENLIQSPDDDYELISAEVGEYVRAGGGAIVELTVIGLNPAPEALRRLSKDLGVHIVSCAGFYVSALHPPWVEDMSVSQLTDFLHKEVTDGMGVRRYDPASSGDRYVRDAVRRRGAGAAGIRSGWRSRPTHPINVHCHPPALEVVQRILDILEEEGHRLDRTSLSHLDEITDLDYHRAVLGREALVGFDSFGQDGYFEPTWKSKSDRAKLETMLALGRGRVRGSTADVPGHAQEVLPAPLRGLGYNHVLARVVPRMKVTYGVDDELIEKLLVTNLPGC